MADIRQRAAAPQMGVQSYNGVRNVMPPTPAPRTQRLMGPPTPMPPTPAPGRSWGSTRGHAGTAPAIGGNPIAGTSGGAMTRQPPSLTTGVPPRFQNSIVRQHTPKPAFTRSRARTV